MRELLKDIINGYDGVVKSVCFEKNLKEIIVILIVNNFSKGKWVSLNIRFVGVKEFCIRQKENFSNTVLSDGMLYEKINGVHYMDFLPLDEELTLDEIRASEFYIGATDITYTLEECAI